MKRGLILVMDSLGIGASADAANYGDEGANTLGHIAEACYQGLADNAHRKGSLKIPNLTRLGLAHAMQDSSGMNFFGLDKTIEPKSAYGYAIEQSKDKDTPSGHWEITGVPVPFAWGTFPKQTPCFPKGLIDSLVEKCKLPGILGNRHASGTEIIKELGEEHVRTGKPICYTSADSVFQIAAHEEHFGLERLIEICYVAKELVDELNITRVIARPFIGSNAQDFVRTANRKDLTTPPIDSTLLDQILEQKGSVISVGKISDIFANRGISKSIKAKNNQELFDATLEALKTARDKTLIFTNFVDFDSHFGHRRDVAGYAQALEEFDLRLAELEALMQKGDLALITADHGCDPTFPGSDHTREHVPVVFFGNEVKVQRLGARNSFADMGQTMAKHLGIKSLKHGEWIDFT